MRESETAAEVEDDDQGMHPSRSAPRKNLGAISAEAPPDVDQEEIQLQEALGAAPDDVAGLFEPLSTCPEKLRRRYERRAGLAASQPLKAIELGCLSCVAWSRPEATRCEIRACPLWAMNRRIFVSDA